MREHEPNHVVIQATEPELFKCPFVMITEVGATFFDEQEALALRKYLQKGGFMWADDFWGEYAWQHWERELRKVLPASEYPIIDVPMNHSIFHTLFDAKRFPQIPSIGWVIQRNDVGAGSRQRDATRARGRRSEGAHHGVHLAQHRFRRFVRARVRRSDVLLQFLRGRLRDRDQHPAICDDALSAATLFVSSSINAIKISTNHSD